jgi:5-methyltetrahydrofolate--homocysteine methyltransferase
MGTNKILENLKQSIIDGNRKATPALAQKAIDMEIPPYTIVTDACSPAMAEVGELYQQGEYFVPEILMSAKAFESAMAVIEPLLKSKKMEPAGTVILGVCEGDIHSIGKNLVATMLEAGGFNVFDLGTDVPAKEFIAAAIKNNADIIGVSALMTTSMIGMKNIVHLVKEQELGVKVMVGGGPVNQEYADLIGANAYGRDAMDAVRVARNLMEDIRGS